MLSTLSILSLDQGKIWWDPCPLPGEDTEAGEQVRDSEPRHGRWNVSALLGWVARRPRSRLEPSGT